MEQQASSTLTVREIVTALHRQSQCGAPEAFRQLAGAVSKAKINPTTRGLEFIYPDPRQFASLLSHAAGCCGFDKNQIRCYSTGGLGLLAQFIGGEFRPLELLDLEIRKRDLHSATTQHGFPYAPEWSNLTDDDRRKGGQQDSTASERQRLINHVVQRLKAEGKNVTAPRVVSTLEQLATWSKSELDRFGVVTAKPGAKRGAVTITWKKSGDDHLPPSTLRRRVRDAKVEAGIRIRNRARRP